MQNKFYSSHFDTKPGVTFGLIVPKKNKAFHPLFNQIYEKDHRNTYLVYYLDGYDEIIVGNQKYIAKKDCVRISSRFDDDEKNALCRSLKQGSFIIISFNCQKRLFDKTIILDVSKHKNIKEDFLMAKQTWIRKHQNYEISINAIMFRTLEDILNIISSDEENNRFRKLENSITYIHDNFTKKDFACDVLHDICGLKSSQFINLFKQKTGTTPSKYVTRLRMNLAVELLLQSNMPIQTIANQVGYDNHSFFSKTFKKTFGVSPSEYSSTLHVT